MRKITIIAGAFVFLFLTNIAHAQPATNINTELQQMELQGTHQAYPSPSQSPVQTQPQTINQNQQPEDQFAVPQQFLENLQNKITALEYQSKEYGDPKVSSWLSGWWQIGFWVGILWLFPWIFVGWQWTKFKFWGFGWPWPWWFFLPLVWFIPWLIIAWQWWLVWWVWWVWIWWLFPWVFWIFWWIIIFKEAAIWHWHRRKSPHTLSE